MNNKEIGGFFGLEKLINNCGEFYPDLIHLNTGRNCLLLIVKNKKIGKIYIPLFLCDSIVNLCRKYNIGYEEYNVGKDLMPIFNKSLKSDEFILIVNYFGFLNKNKIVELKNKYKNIIIDNTQAFFSKPVEGVDTFYSCRKYFGVPDGAYLYMPESSQIELKQDDSYSRMTHIEGRSTYCASDFYFKYRENEALLRTLPLLKMSCLTQELLVSFDYASIKNQRENNYSG